MCVSTNRGGGQRTAKGKKSKAVSKTGSGVVRQWDIMKSVKVPEETIPEFVDPLRWLAYFPPLGKTDLQSFGVCVVCSAGGGETS
jgi:leucyl-tRNA synthetase